MVDYIINEGQFTLPNNIIDRTINNFIFQDTNNNQLNFTVSRDTMQINEELNSFLDKQIKLLQNAIAQYQVLEQKDVTIGADIKAIALYSTWKDSQRNQNIYQRQAVFAVNNQQQLLVFGLTSLQPFDEATDKLWQQWLTSYQPAR
ncbi:DcrB-related protein [Pragia fontium]|uniref:DUF1795 domain-containing protein n=1 Tax=Pragia fontium DSM 5563 = ATCC 49100 TaxID=1122977 RepID=A0AAJ4WBS2_9GAMM|nr:DcrB-related protein [Pragia fontium]SFD07454.1 hypothetical protein SAMN02745723_107172 [Pragia fontium DSM 5563 = ATCC 49100]VEJ56298.1 Uncharacterized conserved protein [Pragia fontium]